MLTKSQILELQNFLNEDHKDLNHVIHHSGLDRESDFEGFHFDGLYMKSVDLSGFNLENASFNGSVLNKVNFAGSNMKNTQFKVSNLRKCTFNQAEHMNSIFLDEVHLFRNHALEKKPNRVLDNFGQGLGKVLFIEDEEKTIENNLIELKGTFPGMQIEVVGNENDARSKIVTESYSIAVIDAKIPETAEVSEDFIESEILRGAEIAKDLSMGSLVGANKFMQHVVLTHFKGALANEKLDHNQNFLGLIQKDGDISGFEDIVIRTMFFEFIHNLNGHSNR
jgi:hypothetical protein